MRRRSSLSIVGAIAFVLLLAILPYATAAGPSPPPLTQEQKEALAIEFSPVLHFTENERTFPVDVRYYLGCSDLRGPGDPNPIPMGSNYSLLGYSPRNVPGGGYFLDDRYGGVNDNGIIERYESDRPYLNETVYAHVTTDGEAVLVQYWMFYVFNDGPLNRHEGDWEMVEFVLNGELTPVSAVYSQHVSGQRMAWSDVALEDGHPTVYVARGSHANFPHMQAGQIGPGADIIGSDGPAMKAGTGYVIALLGDAGQDNHPADQAWLDFAGNWGVVGSTWSNLEGESGPLGPAYREGGAMFTSASWGTDIMTASSANEAADAGAAMLLIAAGLSFGGVVVALVWNGRS